MSNYDDDADYSNLKSVDIAQKSKTMYNKSEPVNKSNRRNDDVGEKKINQYHNNLHGADVMQAVLFFTLNHKAIGGGLTSLDFFSLLFAACIHDANHPGLNTTFVVNDWPASCISTAFGTEVFNNHVLYIFHITIENKLNQTSLFTLTVTIGEASPCLHFQSHEKQSRI